MPFILRALSASMTLEYIFIFSRDTIYSVILTWVDFLVNRRTVPMCVTFLSDICHK